MKGRRAALVPPANIRPVCEESPNGGGATGPHRAVQGRDAALVLDVRIGARSNQEFNRRILSVGIPRRRPRSPVSRVVDRLGAAPISRADVRALPRPAPWQCPISLRCGSHVQRRITSVGVVGDLRESVRARRFAGRARCYSLSREQRRSGEQPRCRRPFARDDRPEEYLERRFLLHLRRPTEQRRLRVFHRKRDDRIRQPDI